MQSTRHANLELSEKHYLPDKVEKAIYELWLGADAFKADNSSSKKPFCIVIPPPNVTGRLHMGHALNNTIQDLICRFKRMKGFDVLWVAGTDHAGISTQSVVKKHLDAEKIDFRELGREGVIERIWKWKEKYGDQILLQLRRLGCSCDWSRTRFTMDEGLSKAVNHAFKSFYDAGLVYRGKYIVNWCPVDRTALSDDEIETKEGGEPGSLWYFKYPLEDKSGFIEIATTRPETMLGDTAVAVNPKDERYKHLIGKNVLVPLVNRPVPLIADDYVDPEFGTGCVKITPAHDPNDFQLGLRHNLPQINIMHENASLNDEVPERFRGLDRFAARKAVIAEMEAAGLLSKTEARNVPVGRSYRSKAIIEYRLSDQWFVKMKPLAEQALKASEEGKVSWFPERWDSYYRDWLHKTRDWCISRQIWWGHRIPAWYHKQSGEIIVETETPARVKAEPEMWYQDEDVLDTWFSSALWPYSTLGWPDKTKDLERYYPTDVLVTGKDIIFFWVARMIMTGLFQMKEVPFHKVLINSIICDEEGETMSKSKGNGIDPLHVIDGATTEELEGPVYEARPPNMEKILKRIQKRFPEGFAGVGADAMRYTLLTSATEAQQLQVSFKRFDEIGRPLTNKIWNASKLAISILDQPLSDASVKASEICPEDKWILGRLDETVKTVESAYEEYQFHRATSELYHFFWNDICDWYLEIIKYRMREGTDAEKRRVQLTVHEIFCSFLRLMHPVMPFITEELWGHFAAKERSVNEEGISVLCASSPFPKDKSRSVPEINESFSYLQEIVRSIRNTRASFNISPKNSLEVSILSTDARALKFIKEQEQTVSRLANLKALNYVNSRPEKQSVTVLTNLEIFADVREYLDKDAEAKRINSAIQKFEKQAESLKQKLSNADFTGRAPTELVNAEKERLREAEENIQKLKASLAEISSL